MILHSKQSGIGKVTGKYQRVTLPRMFDAIIRLLLLMSNMPADCSKVLKAFVLDYTQAFWQIPICPEERKYFCATAILRGKRRYLAFLRVAQGSPLAPLLWCRVAALIVTLTQSLFHSTGGIAHVLCG